MALSGYIRVGDWWRFRVSIRASIGLQDLGNRAHGAGPILNSTLEPIQVTPRKHAAVDSKVSWMLTRRHFLIL